MSTASKLYGSTTPTFKESQIIKLVADGLKNKDIAIVTGTTAYVIKNYLRVIYDKLGMSNRLEVALWYWARDLKQRGKRK